MHHLAICLAHDSRCSPANKPPALPPCRFLLGRDAAGNLYCALMGTKVLRDILADANWGQESLWQADAKPKDGAAQVWAKAAWCKTVGD